MLNEKNNQSRTVCRVPDNDVQFALPLPEVKGIIPAAVCPDCGITLSEIIKTSKVGCPGCYLFFETELSPVIREIHGGAVHIGRVPGGYRLQKERQAKIAELTAKQKKAAADENYELAASMRDEIRKLSAQIGVKEE